MCLINILEEWFALIDITLRLVKAANWMALITMLPSIEAVSSPIKPLDKLTMRILLSSSTFGNDSETMRKKR